MSTDNSPTFSGKPPKSSAQIRSVLKHVHGANADAASAIATGNAQDDVARWVSAAEFRWPTLAQRFADMLQQRQIPTRVAQRGRHWFVEVLSVHMHEALDLFAERRHELQHSSAYNQREAREYNKGRYAAVLFVGGLVALFAAAGGAKVAALLSGGQGYFVIAALLGGVGGIFTWFGFLWIMTQTRRRQ